MPGTAPGLPQCPGSSEDGDSPGLGPVGTSVRSSLQGGTALVRLLRGTRRTGGRPGAPGQSLEKVV